MEKIINCRMTGMGAFTGVSRKTDGVMVEKFCQSQTGNHWKEKIIFQSEQDCALVQDVSNSGKHSCHYVYGDGRMEELCKPFESPKCNY